MKSVFFFILNLVTILSLVSCKPHEQENAFDRDKHVKEINKFAVSTFGSARLNIKAYRLNIDRDSITQVFEKILSDSAELGLAYAKEISHYVELQVDSINRLNELKSLKQWEAKEIADRQNIKKLKSKINKLFNSLISFKNTSDFRNCGFSVGCKYNYWLREVQGLKAAEGADLLLSECGFVVGDLEMLGLEYAQSRGQETEYSKYARQVISDGLKGIKSYE